MSGLNPPLPIQRLHGLGVIARELDPTLESFSEFFGISEWDVRRLASGSTVELTVNGDRVQTELLYASGAANGIHLDIIVPIAGDTLFSAFVRDRPAGVHDLTTNVMAPDDFERAIPELRRNGLTVSQTLRVGADLDIHYLDSAAQLGTVIRILVPLHPQGQTLPSVPSKRVVSPAPTRPGLPIEAPYHVCINTLNRRASVKEAFERIFGIDRWFDYDNEIGVSAANAHYYGQPSNARFRLSCGRRGDFSVEVVEMIYGDSVYKDMTDRYGEGIHHIFTTVCTLDTLKQAKAALAEQGYEIVQDGEVGDIYYGYLAAPGHIAGLSVEMLCPLAPDWTEAAGEDFWRILLGEGYRAHPLVQRS